MKRIFVVLAALLICSCNTYQKRMEGYIGQNINTIIERNGVPTKTIIMSNGNTAYEWDFAGNETSQIDRDSFTGGYTANTQKRYCNTTFITDKSDKIISFNWRGNCE